MLQGTFNISLCCTHPAAPWTFALFHLETSETQKNLSDNFGIENKATTCSLQAQLSRRVLSNFSKTSNKWSNSGQTDAEVDHVKEMLTHSMVYVTPAKHFLQNQSNAIKKKAVRKKKAGTIQTTTPTAQSFRYTQMKWTWNTIFFKEDRAYYIKSFFRGTRKHA